MKILKTLDKATTYIPLASTATNVIDLVVKTCLLFHSNPENLEKGSYLRYLNKKSFIRCFALTIPIFGNLGVFLYDRINAQAKNFDTFKKLVNRVPNVPFKDINFYHTLLENKSMGEIEKFLPNIPLKYIADSNIFAKILLLNVNLLTVLGKSGRTDVGLFLNNKLYVERFVQMDGTALQYASPELRCDLSVIKKAIKQTEKAFLFINVEELKKQKKWGLILFHDLIALNPRIIQYPDLKDCWTETLLERNPDLFKLAPAHVKQDFKLASAAIYGDRLNIQYVPETCENYTKLTSLYNSILEREAKRVVKAEEQKKRREIQAEKKPLDTVIEKDQWRENLIKDPFSYPYAPLSIKMDYELCLIAIRGNPLIIAIIPIEHPRYNELKAESNKLQKAKHDAIYNDFPLKLDTLLSLETLKIDPSTIDLIGDDLRGNADFFIEALKIPNIDKIKLLAFAKENVFLNEDIKMQYELLNRGKK